MTKHSEARPAHRPDRTARESEAPPVSRPAGFFALMAAISAAVVAIMADDFFTRFIMLASVVVCVMAWRHLRDSLVMVALTTLVLGAVGGWGLDLYDRIWWYDDAAHFLFSLVGVMAVGRLFLRRFRADSIALALTGLWLVWLGVGALWEIGEWLADQVSGTHHSRGYGDTMTDMILNTTGAGIGAWAYGRWFRTADDEPASVVPHV